MFISGYEQREVGVSYRQERPRGFGQGVNAPLLPEAKKILSIRLRNGAV